MNQPPAFQFYASDYLSSSKVQRMTLEAEGAYVRLLAYSWQDCGIPEDMQQLARLCKCSPRKMRELWDKYLSKCWVPSGRPGILVNEKQEEIREALLAFKESKSEAGRIGGIKSGEARRKHSFDSASSKDEAKGSSSVFSLQSSSPEEKKESPSEILKKKSATELPADMSITPEMYEWGAEQELTTLQIQKETAKMCDWARSNGIRKKDWLATWRNWLRNSKERTNSANAKQVERQRVSEEIDQKLASGYRTGIFN